MQIVINTRDIFCGVYLSSVQNLKPSPIFHLSFSAFASLGTVIVVITIVILVVTVIDINILH